MADPTQKTPAKKTAEAAETEDAGHDLSDKRVQDDLKRRAGTQDTIIAARRRDNAVTVVTAAGAKLSFRA